MDIHCRRLIDEIEAVNARFANRTERGSHQVELEIQVAIASAWPRIVAMAKVADKASPAAPTAGFNI